MAASWDRCRHVLEGQQHSAMPPPSSLLARHPPAGAVCRDRHAMLGRRGGGAGAELAPLPAPPARPRAHAIPQVGSCTAVPQLPATLPHHMLPSGAVPVARCAPHCKPRSGASVHGAAAGTRAGLRRRAKRLWTCCPACWPSTPPGAAAPTRRLRTSTLLMWWRREVRAGVREGFCGSRGRRGGSECGAVGIMHRESKGEGARRPCAVSWP